MGGVVPAHVRKGVSNRCLEILVEWERGNVPRFLRTLVPVSVTTEKAKATYQVTPDYLAIGDYKKASECLSSAVAVLGSLGVAMFGLSLGAAFLAPRLFHLPAGLEREAFICILIVGSSSALQFALQP